MELRKDQNGLYEVVLLSSRTAKCAGLPLSWRCRIRAHSFWRQTVKQRWRSGSPPWTRFSTAALNRPCRRRGMATCMTVCVLHNTKLAQFNKRLDVSTLSRKQKFFSLAHMLLEHTTLLGLLAQNIKLNWNLNVFVVYMLGVYFDLCTWSKL